ncbi:hypothetical protein [Algoriphagus aquimarinus]|uniref:hypothetical protein n=1 Tax=Algoriphagus aquimarinus TaxID=237018 RepID=UPI0030DCF676
MKKLKLIAMGVGIMGISAFGISYFGASEAAANSNSTDCEWNGSTCLDPQRTNICWCEDVPVED